jgi:subtilase family serine protease
MLFRRLAVMLLTVPALLVLSGTSAFSLPRHNVPDAVVLATDEGRVDPAQEMNLTIFLKMHDRDGFDKAVEALYDPASAGFHKWFTDADFEPYAPTRAEFETVQSELAALGFQILSYDPRLLSIRVRGNAAAIERSFQTELHTFSLGGRVFQAQTSDARLAGPAGELIDSVCGLARHAAELQVKYLKDPLTGERLIRKPLTTMAQAANFFGSLNDVPLSGRTSVSFSDDYAKASYTGLQYEANGGVAGLTPSQLQDHYGLTSLIAGGYDGTGQTIALVEAYAYPNAEADANVAAKYFGLPALLAEQSPRFLAAGTGCRGTG